MADIFGFLRKNKNKPEEKGVTFARPLNDDGAVDIDVNYVDYAGQMSQLFDLDRIPTNEYELMQIYRTMSLQQEVDEAIQEIVNEAIITDEMKPSVDIILNDVDLSDKIKERIVEEFYTILKLLNFKNNAYNLFNRWYVDGKIIFHKVVDINKPSNGIINLVPIDPQYIKYVREIPRSKNKDNGELELYDLEKIEEYFIYSQIPITQKDSTNTYLSKSGVKIPKKAITYCTSGLTDESGKTVLSYLYKAIKPWNNLKLMEDSMVIYRMVRAPERRVFYVDVGNLPKGKAEQYLKDIMNRFKNKVVYDSSTGTITNQKKYLSMIEDWWLPRREGGRGTEISTLPGGDNLGEIDDTKYFKDKLYRALNIPLSRFQQEGAVFNVGRTTEITRDEVKFSKFISRLRKRFSFIFDDILKTQLILKKILTEEEFDEIISDISYSFIEDNYFSEFKEMEVFRERLQTISELQNSNLIGTYYSHTFVKKKILKLTDEEIDEMQKEIEEERKKMDDEDIPDPDNLQLQQQQLDQQQADRDAQQQQRDDQQAAQEDDQEDEEDKTNE